MGSSQSTTQDEDEEQEQEENQHQNSQSDSQNSSSISDQDQDEEQDEEEEEESMLLSHSNQHTPKDILVKKILQQEPEMLPYHQSASPLSPQLSTYSATPRVGPSIKVWDPYNVLAPPPPPPQPHFRRTYSDASSCNGAVNVVEDDGLVTEVYLISHGECFMSLRPDLIAGRCPDAKLTGNGKRQARALAVFLKSQGVNFNAVYCSRLDRARATAVSVCQELNLPEDHIQSSDALVEMSQGHWEGCHRSDILTPETVSIMDRSQPDFSAPSGESLRQVEFRMVQFLNSTVIAFPDKYRTDFSPPDPSDNTTFQNHTSHSLSNHDRDGPSLVPPNWDLLHRHRQGPLRKKSGKSRLQVVTTTGDNEADDEMSPREPPMTKGLVRDLNVRTGMAPTPCVVSSCVGVFTHAIPIKCLLTGILGCGPVMSHKICVDDSSITVLQHSWKLGWQIKRMNDTSHLRLL